MTSGPTPTTDQGDAVRAFLQRRVAAFGLMATVIGSIGFVMRPALVYASGHPELLLHPVALAHLLAFVPLTGAWLLLRRGSYSRRAVLTIEQAALFLSCLGFIAVGVHLPVDVSPEYVVPFGFGLVLILRAVFVPSPARRTLLTSLAAAPVIVGSIFFIYTRVDPPNVGVDLGTGMTDAWAIASMSSVWWVFITVITTVTSKVIYGLRREIRDIRKLGQYTLERKLGEGGMGAVYRASHSMLRRPAAIKLLPPRKVGEASLARFEREVQMTAKLSHANTITVFDYGRTPDGVFYYVMELIEGINLAEVVRIDGPQPPERVVHLLVQAAGSLAEAHEIGLIHRDIKPANLMLCRQGGVPDTIKVVDFGLVKEVDSDVSASLTNADMIQGTPQYMAPEAIRDPRHVGPAADIYGLGAVAYFLLTGTHLFEGNAVEVCGHHLHTTPDRPSSRISGIPAELDALIMSCLEKDPLDRPSSAAELQAQLEELPLPRWPAADARAWWKRFAAEVSNTNHGEELTTGVTLEVDLGVLAPQLPAK